jgi:hypothetical protein
MSAYSNTGELLTLILERLDGVKRCGRHYYAKCIFHDDERPSLVVTPDVGLYHCFGCHAAGTLTKLAKHLGIPVSGAPLRDYKIMERAWQRAEEACKLLEALRRIPRHVSMSFSVGLVGEDGDEAVAIPYPYGKDLTGIIFWRYKDTQRRYSYSQGIKIEMPFAMPRAVVTPPPTFIVEGAFDCMSLYAVGRGAVATLGTRSIIAALDVLQSVVLAPDNDKAGRQYLQRWLDEVGKVGAWDRVSVCIWRSKDPNDALKAGRLEDELKEVIWSPVFVIVDTVKRYRESWRSELSQYAQTMSYSVWCDAKVEAEERLRRDGINVSISDDVVIPPQRSWEIVLEDALRDKEMAKFIFNEGLTAEGVQLVMLPPKLRGRAWQSLMALELSKPHVWSKCEWTQKQVRWALRRAKEEWEKQNVTELAQWLAENLSRIKKGEVI